MLPHSDEGMWCSVVSILTWWPYWAWGRRQEQKECYVHTECDNLKLWWANYLPFEPGTPSVPLIPGTPFVPLTPGTPSIPLTPGTPSVPSSPSSPIDISSGWWTHNMHPTWVLGSEGSLSCDSSLSCVCKIVFPVCTATDSCYRVNKCVFEWSHLVHLDHRGYPMSVPKEETESRSHWQGGVLSIESWRCLNVVGLLTLFTLSTC